MDTFLQSPDAGPILLILAPVACLLFFAIRRRREGIRHHLRKFIARLVVFVFVTYLLATNGTNPYLAIDIGVLCGFGVEGLVIPKRSRYIRQAERRKAIAKFELTGEKFNPKKHELDHEIAFARFGSSTADNLRVVERHVNRSKGKKSPWWDIVGR